MARPIIICSNCGLKRPCHAYTWCSGCYTRWLRAGRPGSGPPAREFVATAVEAIHARLAEYRRLHDLGTADWEIATQLHVSPRTVERYRHRLGLIEHRTSSEVAMPQSPGSDFANRRDLNANVSDLSPEHLATALGNVERFARDDAERETFLEMLGLAPYASGDRGQYGNRHRTDRAEAVA